MTMLTDLDRLAVLTEAARYGVISSGDTSRESADAAHESTDTGEPTEATSYQAYRAARAHRDSGVAKLVVATIQAVGALARRVRARYLQRRRARLTYDALRQLDDRMLHDLGFDRSEMTSIAAEIAAEVEYSRVRAQPSPHVLSV